MDHRQAAWTVLVVEDEWLLRADIVSYLRAAGWRVIEASNGETALALVEDGAPVDVLFTDIALGGHVDGWELGEKLRALRPASGVIYASGRYGERRRAVARSVAIEKPYSRDEVLLACNGMCAAAPPQRFN